MGLAWAPCPSSRTIRAARNLLGGDQEAAPNACGAEHENAGRSGLCGTAATRLVWVVDPERRVARVYRGDGSAAIVGADEALEGEDVLPGFSCRLSEVL